MKVDLQQTTILFEDPEPCQHQPQRGFAQPDPLSRWFAPAAHRAGSQKNSADGVRYLWRSRNEGLNWSRIPFPFAPSGRLVEQRQPRSVPWMATESPWCSRGSNIAMWCRRSPIQRRRVSVRFTWAGASHTIAAIHGRSFARSQFRL